jgi:hypothetical protein
MDSNTYFFNTDCFDLLMFASISYITALETQFLPFLAGTKDFGDRSASKTFPNSGSLLPSFVVLCDLFTWILFRSFY